MTKKHADSLRSKLGVETSASITCFQYNHSGSQLAVSDSDGNVFIYHRGANDQFTKAHQFHADDAAVWSVAWADPIYGEVLAIGSFRRKVGVWRFGNGGWTQIAQHQIHQGSVNCVEWAPSAYGLKLYAAGSEGQISLLELKKNQWNTTSFFAHECSIHSISIRPVPLTSDETENSSLYPLIASVGKDLTLKIWKHVSQVPQAQLSTDARLYQMIASFRPHKQAIRGVLFKKRWTQSPQYQVFTWSQDGIVKLNSFLNSQHVSSISLVQFEQPIYKVTQSLTGNMISIAVADQEEKNYLLEEKEKGKWQTLQTLK